MKKDFICVGGRGCITSSVIDGERVMAFIVILKKNEKN
jgi:hypothetical protein